MNPNFSHSFFLKSSLFLWFIFTIIICLIVSQQGASHTVTPSYLTGSNLWLQGKDLYDGTGRGFIYLPQAAVLFVPFAYISQFSFTGAEIIWRVLSLVLLGYAVWRFVKLAKPELAAYFFFIATIVTIPLVFSSARNGQFNTILEVMMLLAVSAIARENWWRAAVYLALGFALKPTMMVLLLLLGVLYRPLWWRLALGLLGVFIFPFFAQASSYVWVQYLNSILMLKTAATLGANTYDWAQFFGLLAHFKLFVAENFQTIIRIIAAFFVLFCGLKARKKFNSFYAAIFLYTLASCYLMLFNPRTEHNDYGIVAPALGLFISMFFIHGYWGRVLLLALVFIGLVFAGHFSFTGNREFWSAPFFTIIFVIIVVQQIFCGHLVWKKRE